MSVKFLITRADVNLQMFVADAAHDVTAEQIAAKFPAGVPIHETDFAAGPNQ